MDFRNVLRGNKDAVDPYVRVRLGDQSVDNKRWGASNASSPVFGHKLCIQYDHPSTADHLVIEIVDDDPGKT